MAAPHQQDPGARGTSRRALLTGTVTGAAGLALGSGLSPAAAAVRGRTLATSAGLPSGGTFPARPGRFVTTRDGSFSVGGAAWRFGGTNTYYLHQQSHYMIDSALNDAAAMSLAAVRAWAFADGSGGSYTALQPKPYVYDDAAFDSLDYAISKAGQLGLRLVLALVNNWPDYGGMAQYVSWFLGLPDDSYGAATNHDMFYSTRSIQDCYRAYVKYVTDPVQPLYRPAVQRRSDDHDLRARQRAPQPERQDRAAAADLGHARPARTSSTWPRTSWSPSGTRGSTATRPTPTTRTPTTRETAGRTSSRCPPSTTARSTCTRRAGGRTRRPSRAPTRSAGAPPGSPDHLSDGAALRKPVVIEEYGLAINAAQGIADEAARDAGYRTWTDTVLARGGAGDQFWLLTSRVDDGSFYPDYDGYRIIWDNEPGNSTNAAAQLLSAHARAMAAAS